MGALFAQVSVVSIVVADMVDPRLALLPCALQKLVATFVAFPGARHKNRKGFASAALLGCIGYGIAAAAISFIDNPTAAFVVLCFGYCLAGFYEVFTQFLRFAAADISPLELKPRAIAYVLAGGSLAALIGPELANLMVDLVPGRRYAGSYLGASLVLLLECCIIQFIDFAPASASASLGPVAIAQAPAKASPGTAPVDCADVEIQVTEDPVKPTIEGEQTAKPTHTSTTELGVYAIVRQPRFMLVASTAAISQLTMISLMQIAPLAMKEVGLELWQSVRVVQAHILGMYIPSFFTGELMAWFGKHRVMLLGIATSLAAALCLLVDPESFWSYAICLTVIGLGWNWAFVGATSLLTDTVDVYGKADQARAKGFNDLCIQSLGAMATLGTGFVVELMSWEALALICAALLGAQLLAIVFQEEHLRAAPAKTP